ncbi:MAG: leucine-rich repeat domain-containing protein [Bacteroidetes bacterium]|uniref:Leucine-rich repeat domain-containing protein n=1 Tax=Candidatus Limisoma faecipullorum TaxID=2840854 RepID=A0A9D9NJC8_9BACT|nr:leucine-rich repeat domain-containing protein [Candidatus Limisoma faecipullorum]
MNRFFMRPLLAAAALLTASTATADYFYDSQGIQYGTLDETTCEVQNPRGYSSDSSYSGNISIPEQVTNNGKTYTVTQIGRHAFYGAKNLDGVVVPKTVTVIYEDAFYGCGLGWIRFEDGEEPIEFKSKGTGSMTRVFDEVPVVNAYIGRDFIFPGGPSWKTNPPFSWNDALQIVEIGDLVTSIPSCSFNECHNLFQVTIGSGVKTIGDDAFGETGVENLYIDNLEQWCNIDFGTFYSSPLAFNHGWLHVGGADAVYDIVIPDGVTKINSYAFAGARLNSVTVPSGVTEIGEEAFAECWGDFQTVHLPEGLQSIGYGAFANSTLKRIEIPESVTYLGSNMFFRCNELEEAIINAQITSVEEYSFYQCGNLRTVVLPPTLRIIHDWAFSSCISLQSIDIPEGVTEIGDVAFSGYGFTSVIIPNSVRTLGAGCFQGSKLTSVVIGTGLSEIPDDCFSGSELTSVTLPDNVTSLGEEAFGGCASLAEVNIGKGLKQIKDKCFAESGLKSVSLPSNVTSIGVEAFAGCASLETVDLSTRLREIPEKCFQNSGLVTITLPENITTVGEAAFSKCFSMRSITVLGPKNFEAYAFFTNNYSESDRQGLNVYIDDLADWCERTTFANEYASPFYTWYGNEHQSLYLDGELVENLVIPDGVVKINDYTFNDCGSIKSVVVPDGVVSIGTYAFSCPELTKATIGKNVNTIGMGAFTSEKLAEFISWNPVPPTGSGIGYHSDDFTVYVPAGSVDAYKSAEDWRYYNIKAIGDGGVEEIGGGEVSVSVVDGRIVVSGADDDAVVEVYDLSGRRVYAGVAAEIPLTDGGVYIVKVAGQAFKMAV